MAIEPLIHPTVSGTTGRKAADRIASFLAVGRDVPKRLVSELLILDAG
jgi:hypothetical protein